MTNGWLRGRGVGSALQLSAQTDRHVSFSIYAQYQKMSLFGTLQHPGVSVCWLCRSDRSIGIRIVENKRRVDILFLFCFPVSVGTVRGSAALGS